MLRLVRARIPSLPTAQRALMAIPTLPTTRVSTAHAPAFQRCVMMLSVRHRTNATTLEAATRKLGNVPSTCCQTTQFAMTPTFARRATSAWVAFVKELTCASIRPPSTAQPTPSASCATPRCLVVAFKGSAFLSKKTMAPRVTTATIGQTSMSALTGRASGWIFASTSLAMPPQISAQNRIAFVAPAWKFPSRTGHSATMGTTAQKETSAPRAPVPGLMCVLKSRAPHRQARVWRAPAFGARARR